MAGQSYSEDTIRIRKGDSLLLTATGAGAVLELDGHDDGTFEHSGAPGDKFPTLYSTAGTFVAKAKIDSVEVGTLTVVVVSVDLHGPIACEVGFQREKDVTVNPAAETNEVAFVANDAFWLMTSVKQNIATGASLFLKPLRRGTPALEARLGGAAGPLLARQEVDEFTYETPALLSALFDDDTDVGTVVLTMRPYVPAVRWQFDMFASTATFSGGQTSLSVNTSDAAFKQVFDEETGETVGEFELDIEMPDGEDKYCFNLEPRQSASREVAVGAKGAINGHGCKVTVSQIFFCVGETEAKNLRVDVTDQIEDPPAYYRIYILDSVGMATEAYFPLGGGAGKTKSKVRVKCDEPGPFEEPTLPGTTAKVYDVKVGKYSRTIFKDRIVVVEVTNAALTPPAICADGTSTSQGSVTIQPDGRPVVWSIEGEALGCTIDSTTGVVTAGTMGGTITVRAADAQAPACHAEAALTLVKIDNVQLAPGIICADGSSTSQASAEITPTDRTIVWSIQGNALDCTIDSTTGVVTAGTTGGKITVRAQDSELEECFSEGDLLIFKATIKSIRFTSDHGLLRDNNTDFNDTGSLYPEPEWDPSRGTHPNAPISHTMGLQVQIVLSLIIETPGSFTYTLNGDGPGTHLDFNSTGTLTMGENSIPMTSLGSLPAAISPNAGGLVSWTLISANCTQSFNTGPHKIYATAGTPYGSVITEKRMNHVTTLCDGLTAAHPCATIIHDSTPSYALGSSRPIPIWLIAGGAPAECHRLSEFYKAGIEMLGWPTGTIVFLYPTLGFGSKETTSSGDNEVRAADGAKMIFIDGSGGSNNFEGAFKYTVGGITKYYAGGAGIYDTPQECMDDICDKTKWLPPTGPSVLAEDWP